MERQKPPTDSMVHPVAPEFGDIFYELFGSRAERERRRLEREAEQLLESLLK